MVGKKFPHDPNSDFYLLGNTKDDCLSNDDFDPDNEFSVAD